MARDTMYMNVKSRKSARMGCVILVTAVLGFFVQVNAQSVDPVVEEGVQILIEKHEIMDLKKNGQIDPEKAQERLQANKQRWDKYSLTIAQWPKEKQLALAEQIKKRTAVAIATREQTMNAEVPRLQKEGNALGGQESASRITPAAEGEREAKTPSGGHALKSNDVIGITIGMSVSEVKNLLSSKFPSNSNLPINFASYGKEWIGQYLSLPAAMTKRNSTFDKKADEVVVIDFSSPPLKQEVLAVLKYQSYPNDKTPSLLATETALIEKYGQWDKKDEKGGTNYYFWGKNPQSSISCISLGLIDPIYRLKDVIRAASSQSVICQAYGTWGQCVKQISSFIKLESSLKGCGEQVAAYVRFTSKQSKDVSPVMEIATFVADLSRLYDSEVAFTELARKYEKNKNQESIKLGGAPKL